MYAVISPACVTTMLRDVIVVVDVMGCTRRRSMLLCMYACGSVSISYGTMLGVSLCHGSSGEIRKYTKKIV